jgi:aldehyde dehydrogenase (NAD+)
MGSNNLRFYIGGQWVDPAAPAVRELVNPASEQPFAEVAMGGVADVDRAVAAARGAFPRWSQSNVAERIELLEAIAAAYEPRIPEVAALVTQEMGSPADFARAFHAAAPVALIRQVVQILRSYDFERPLGSTQILREPIGVCGLISPWNVPVGTLMNKIAPALAAGCTVVAKPSEFSPLSPLILFEAMHEAGVPTGVVNLVNGDGPTAGQAIAAHPGVDMISFTGSPRAGALIAKAAADTFKRVQQELGGKSANIVLPDADLDKVVTAGLQRSYVGGGQSCQAPTRMLVPAAQHARACAAAGAAAESYVVGDPLDPRTQMGPLVNRAQFDRVQRLIGAGISEGATLVTGGLGRPAGLDRGYYVRPTVFGNVDPRSTIAQEEIFGPVLSIIPYQTEEQAIEIANDSPYGLAGWVYSGDLDHARSVARRMRTGRVYLNGAPADPAAPFGGYKHSGNGREGGVFGLEEFLEIKALLGSNPPGASA